MAIHSIPLLLWGLAGVALLVACITAGRDIQRGAGDEIRRALAALLPILDQ